jgi:hypothetical protein
MNFNKSLAKGSQNQATDAAEDTGNQAEGEKFYTQKEVDDMMAGLKSSVMKKALKPYEDLGDPEELRALRAEAEKRQQEQQLKRGEFEKTLQEMAAKKDAEIAKRDSIIREYKVNSPLVSAAAKYRAVNADQVKALLMPNVRLNGDGEVEVVDTKGSVRYSDAGTPLAVDDLVREFLDSNPHFVAATPATTHSRSNVSNNMQSEVDVSKLDMRNAEHRKIYKNLRDAKKI